MQNSILLGAVLATVLWVTPHAEGQLFSNPQRFVLSGTVTEIQDSPDVETGIEVGYEVTYTVVFDFGRAARMDEALSDALFAAIGDLPFDITQVPPIAGGFYADLVVGSQFGPAESFCAGGSTLDEPIVAEANFGLNPFVFGAFVGYANDFVLLLGDSDNAPRDWTVGTQITGRETICDYENRGRFLFVSDLVVESITDIRSAENPGGFGEVAGRITNSVTGDEITCATVVAFEDGTEVASSSADENGDYFIRQLPWGEYTLQAFAPGFESESLEVDTTGDSLEIEDFELMPATFPTVIAGTVVDAETMNPAGDPIPEAPIGGARVDALIDGAIVSTTFTCASGRYELVLDSSKQDTVTVRVTAPGFDLDEQEVETGSNHDVGLTKALFPGFISGVVTNADTDDPLPGVNVSVQGITKSVSLAVTTADEGQYSTGGLGNGEYAVRVTADGFLTETVFRSVETGLTTVNLELEPGDQPPPMVSQPRCPRNAAAYAQSNPFDEDVLLNVRGDMIMLGLVTLALAITGLRGRKRARA